MSASSACSTSSPGRAASASAARWSPNASSFAREAGYDRVRLWTHTVLPSARRIYEAQGFRIVSTEVHHEFGKPEQGETWELALTA